MEKKRYTFEYLPPSLKYISSSDIQRISEEQVNTQTGHKILFCTICSYLMESPTTLNCGHTFCEECLRTWFKTKQSCPTCRESSCELKQLKKNIIINEMIQELPIKCPSDVQTEKPKCGANLKVKDFRGHLKTCSHIVIPCICKTPLTRATYFESDQKCACPEAVCLYCLAEFPERLLSYHMDACRTETITCSYCSKTMLRKDNITHELEECFVSCPYANYGCKVDKLTRVLLKKHLDDELNNHKLLLIQFTQPEVFQKVDRLSKELEKHKVTPPKYIKKELIFEFKGKRIDTMVLLNATIKKVIENIYTQLFSKESLAACTLWVIRKKTGGVLDPSLTFLSYDIQELEIVELVEASSLR